MQEGKERKIYIYIQRYAVIWNDIYRREKSSNDGILRDKCSFDVDQFLNKITYLYLYSDAIKKIIDINKPSDRLNFSSLKFKIIYIYFSNFFKFRSINQKNFYHRWILKKLVEHRCDTMNIGFGWFKVNRIKSDMWPIYYS